VYLTIPFIQVFGLSEGAVRLPSALMSILTVYATFLIGSLLGKKILSVPYIGEVAALLVAVSPWHMYISRLGHEANAGLTLVVLGVLFLLQAVLENKRWSLVMSGVLFGLSAHGYQSEKIVSPMLILTSMVMFWKQLRAMKKQGIVALVACFLIALPAIVLSMSPEGLSRFQGTTAFSHDAPEMVLATKKYSEAIAKHDVFGRFTHSRYVVYGSIFLKNYVSHFSPAWLFTGGIREAHKVPGLGLFHFWEILLIVIGIYAIHLYKKHRVFYFILAWILISPLPAAITTQAPHAMRFYTAIPGVQLLEAVAIWFMFSRHILVWKRIVVSGFAVAVFSGIALLYTGYFIRFPKEQSDSFQYALPSAIRYANGESSQYRGIQFSNQGNLYQSYMFYLFYSRFDPEIYQRLGGTRSGGYNEAHVIGPVSFGFLPEQRNIMEQGILYFYDARLVPEGTRVRKTFELLDGTPAIVAVTL